MEWLVLLVFGYFALQYLGKLTDWLFPPKCPHGKSINSPCKSCDELKIKQIKKREQEAERAKAQQEHEAAERKKAEKRREESEKQKRIKQAKNLQDLNYLKSLDPYKFEHVVLEMFGCLGWEDIKATPKSGDGGIDGIMHKDGETYVVQCKRLSTGNVGSPVLHSLRGAMAKIRAEKGVVVTTVGFTPQAQEWVRGEPILLMGGELLVKNMQKAFKNQEFFPKHTAAAPEKSPQDLGICPSCGSTLEKKSGRYGIFVGCTNYPVCKFTRDLPGYSKSRPKRHNRYRRR